MAKLYRIVDRRVTDVLVDGLSGLELDAHDEVADSIVLDAGWTLFSFDFATHEAVFMDVGEDCDLSAAPFCYLAQYDKATRLVRISFVVFLELAKRIPRQSTLVQLFNIGHCGSTLLHHVFNQAPGVWCVSEPMFTFDVAMRNAGASPKLLQDLMTVGIAFLSLFPSAQSATTIVLKHFSQATRHLRLMHDARPEAKCLFLYRDGAGWCNSIYHFLQRRGGQMDMGQDERTFVWWIMSGDRPVADVDGIVDMNKDIVGFDEMAAVAWVLQVRDDILRDGAGLGFLPLRYNELTAQKRSVVARIFDYCGISTSHTEAALSAFEHDAHAGTSSANDKVALDFGPENYARIERVFAHPRMDYPGDSLLPGTFIPPLP